MLVVTHEMGFARDVSTRVMFLDQGLVEAEGSPNELFHDFEVRSLSPVHFEGTRVGRRVGRETLRKRREPLGSDASPVYRARIAGAHREPARASRAAALSARAGSRRRTTTSRCASSATSTGEPRATSPRRSATSAGRRRWSASRV